jgi:hypothetical protein
LKTAVAEFKKHYLLFAEENKEFIIIETGVDSAIQKAEAEEDVRKSAHVFGREITNVMRLFEQKESLSKGKWTSRVGDFLTKLYPVARLSLQLTGVIAEVLSPHWVVLRIGRKFYAIERRSRWIRSDIAG